MTCPHLPGSARLLLGRWAARLALGVAALAALPGTAAAAPSATRAATPAAAASSASKTAHPPTKPSKAKKSTGHTTPKKRTTRRGKTAAAAGAGAAAATAAAAPEERDPADTGVRLPLMLRVTPALPDNLTALRSRLDSVLTAQGAAAQGATVDNVSQLGPDIYAFALRCADAEQCQRLRLAIESERDWVAGLQLDERRRIPRTPERNSPAAR